MSHLLYNFSNSNFIFFKTITLRKKICPSIEFLNITPKKGAQVFFTRNGKIDGVYHTGLVYKVDSTYFYTIEGNTSKASTVVSNGGGVAKKKYLKSKYKGKVLFGRPKYDYVQKSAKEIAYEVIRGLRGNGRERRSKLIEAGYNPSIVQSYVKDILNEKKES